MDISTLILHLAAEPLTWTFLFGALAILPHCIALSPRVAQGLGLVSSILNVIAGNYAAAANGKAMAGRIVGALDRADRAQQDGDPVATMAALEAASTALDKAQVLLGSQRK